MSGNSAFSRRQTFPIVRSRSPVGAVVEGMDVVDRLYAGYGESAGGGMRGGKQDPIFAGGNAWLDANFPRLDHLVSARVTDAAR